MEITIVIEVLLTLACVWGILHEDRLIALERYYIRRWRRKHGK